MKHVAVVWRSGDRRAVRFSANISILFKEVPFLERLGRAAEAGFVTVEFWWPSDEDLGEVEKAVKDAGLRVALFNFDAGDMASGDRGLVSDPSREEQFRENVPTRWSWLGASDARG